MIKIIIKTIVIVWLWNTIVKETVTITIIKSKYGLDWIGLKSQRYLP